MKLKSLKFILTGLFIFVMLSCSVTPKKLDTTQRMKLHVTERQRCFQSCGGTYYYHDIIKNDPPNEVIIGTSVWPKVLHGECFCIQPEWENILRTHLQAFRLNDDGKKVSYLKPKNCGYHNVHPDSLPRNDCPRYD